MKPNNILLDIQNYPAKFEADVFNIDGRKLLK